MNDSALTRIVVATDGSAAARAAALRASQLLARPFAVTLLTVITDPPGGDAGGIEGPVATPEEEAQEWERDEREARQALEDTRHIFDEQLSRTEASVLDERLEVGEAGPAICAVAEHTSADLIVMGSRGHGRVRSLLFGSTAEHVIHHASCPVMLVKAPDG